MKIKKKCIVIFVSSAMILSMFSYEIAYLTFAKDTTAVSQEEIIDHRDYIGDLSSLPYSEGGLGLFQEEDSYTIKLGDTNIPDNDKKINIEKLRILEGNFKEGSDKILKIDEGVLLPDLSEAIFKGYKCDIEIADTIDTSNVISMKELFMDIEKANPDVSSWDVSNVQNFYMMFESAKEANPDVSNWNTSRASSMYRMFRDTEKANPDVSDWNVSNVSNMYAMFCGAKLANPDVSKWETNKLRYSNAMFRNAKNANPDVSNWITSEVVNIDVMFEGAEVASPDVSKWNTSKVESMKSVFKGAKLANPDVSKWDTSSVENMYSLFCSAKEANPDVSKWNIEKVIYINAMFRDTEKADPDVSKWDTSSAENMESMFCGAKLANPDVSKWNTSKVKSMKAMFKNSKLANPDVSDWDTVKVEDMERMFENAENAKPDVSKWSVKNLSNAELIFSGTAAKELDIRNMRSLDGISEGKRTIYNNKNLEKIVFSYEEENKNYFPLESIYMNAANYKLYKIVDEEAYNKNSDKGKLKIKEFSLALEKNASAESNISIASKINEAVENELENSTDRKVSFEIKLDESGTENGGNGGNGGGTTSKNYAILASGDNYTDALVSSVLANEKKGPILLTEKNKISKETLREIDRLALDELIVVGGEESISKNIFEGLKNKDYTVRRISGQNRYETAKKIGQEVRLTSKNTDLAILVDGRNFPNAISVSDLASERRVPILLTEADLLNKETKEALRDWNKKKLTIAGAEKSVSKNIEEKLKASIKDVDRIAGKDRYETSYLVAKELRSKIDNKNNMILVDGRNFPDGITVASLLSKYKSPILLTTGDKIHPRVAKAINDWSIENILITGGYKSV